MSAKVNGAVIVLLRVIIACNERVIMSDISMPIYAGSHENYYGVTRQRNSRAKSRG